MKNKLFKRISTTLLAILMVLAISVPAFAVAPVSEFDWMMDDNAIVIPASPDGMTVVEYTFDASNYNEVSLNDNVVLPSLSIEPNTTEYLYPTLSSYIGLNQTFAANTVSDSTTGAIELFLYSPSGKLVSDQWIMGVNEAVKWTVWLPSSGTWTLRIFALATNAPVRIAAGWPHG